MNTDEKIKKISDEAIPLDMTCEIKRKEQISRRARLRIDIQGLIRDEVRDKTEPYKPELEYKQK